VPFLTDVSIIVDIFVCTSVCIDVLFVKYTCILVIEIWILNKLNSDKSVLHKLKVWFIQIPTRTMILYNFILCFEHTIIGALEFDYEYM
jgi:hypothetical protein